MPPKNKREIDRFLRVATQRLDDAQLLLEGHRYTGAVYLAGYAIECTLKALLLSATPASQSRTVIASFRGKDGHSFESLKAKYLRQGGVPYPKQISGALTLASRWTTEMRYDPADTPAVEARRFLTRAAEIIDWSKGRL